MLFARYCAHALAVKKDYHPATGKFGCHENWQPHVDINYYTSKHVFRRPVVMSLARLEKMSSALPPSCLLAMRSYRLA